MDPQSDTTTGFGINKNVLERDIYDVLVNQITLENILHNTIINRLDLDLVPATTGLSGAEVDLVNMNDREKKLKFALERFHGMYKYIIIDCPPISWITHNKCFGCSG
jgi:chromosome partitioning protein